MVEELARKDNKLVHKDNVESLLGFLLGLPRPEPLDDEGAYDYDLEEEIEHA